MISSPLLASVPGLTHGFYLPGDAEPKAITAHQVHKASWLWLPKGASPPAQRLKVDAIASSQPQISVGVLSADCVPVLVAALDTSGRPFSVAAIHAGWRGSAQQITGRVVSAWLLELTNQQKPTKLVAAIGPCISKDSFEVGPEVPAAFSAEERQLFSEYLREEGGRRKYRVDLVGANTRQLENAAREKGVALELAALGRCTVKEIELPSFRRNGKNAGRILSVIGLAS